MKDNRNYLPEIDGLRAFAVSVVIVNHFFEAQMPSGFLGVDIFFVISGFVITSYLKKISPENWSEYFGVFYLRRFKRLFPALFFCILLTSILFLLLTTRPSADIFRTGIFALFGLSNNYLFHISTDYFSLDAKLNPFTHTWSLGIEEQFYLFFPLIFALLGYVKNLTKKTIIKGNYALICLTALSLIGYVVSYYMSKSAAFYLIPNRLWELCIGSLSYLAYEQRNLSNSNRFSSFIVLILLFSVLFLPNKFQLITTIACVALTALLLYSIRRGDVTHKILTTKILVFIGLISYSLYLWHWSILVLGKWTIGEHFYSKVLLLTLTFFIALFSYYFIERPLRYRTWFKSKALTMTYVGVAVFSLVVFNALIAPNLGNRSNNLISSSFDIPQVTNWGKELNCHGRENLNKFSDPFEHCLKAYRTNEKTSVIYLIGDSHAAQFVSMSRKAFANSSFFLRFINTEESSDFPYDFIRNKNSKTNTLEYIVDNSKNGDYVIISFHRGHLNDARDSHIPLSQTININEETRNFIQNAKSYIKVLQGKGVKVILIKDTPLMRVVATSPSCLLQIRLFGESICRVSKEQDLHTRYRQDYAFDKLQETFDNVFVWDPSITMYGQKPWIDVVDDFDNYLMFDWNHISTYQSVLLLDDFRVFFNFTRPFT